MTKPKVVFIVDTREQNPYRFTCVHRRDLSFGGVSKEALKAGDYSIRVNGTDTGIIIERKGLVDLYGVVGNGRERFERELEKLRFLSSYLVIEATAAQVLDGYERSKISGEAALGSVLHWSTQFGIAPIFAGNWTIGQRITRGILEDFAAHFEENCVQGN